MPKGISIHIGLNAVNPKAYEGWSGELVACEADANDMQKIAERAKFTSHILLTAKATRKAVQNVIKGAAKALAAGDILWLSYSGHGGQLPDVSGDEPDHKDETWCLFDGEFLDDELFSALGAFKKGVRIFVLSDSCHSGTVLRNAIVHEGIRQADAKRFRAMPRDVALRTYLAHQKFYDTLGSDPKHKDAEKQIAASAILISGGQDNQLSSDGDFNGLFTGEMKEVWRNGAFKGNYRKFHRDILKLMPRSQSPNFFAVGPHNADFEAQKPFTI
jgi:hypothetical protein